ncbi:hypothetical protein PAHAL_8G079400 [Panicum hallii]|uniref:Secreted protein n=1 Tax=Panicum hallii TaxID=206008 RepID=A0A2T8I883_9POAL|nr:hypothetical protein PAHAL_8G079400 [Panicum hallii]
MFCFPSMLPLFCVQVLGRSDWYQGQQSLFFFFFWLQCKVGTEKSVMSLINDFRACSQHLMKRASNKHGTLHLESQVQEFTPAFFVTNKRRAATYPSK